MDKQDPGMPPYRRGIYKTMYAGKLWTMRQYSGFSSPEKTNTRFRKLLESGQTGISVAFDLPTQLGLDSDDDLSLGEVGKVGVAIDTIHDMRKLFDSIDLEKISTSMTINAPATTLLAMYVAIADERGIDRKNISGTVQNDILKEYMARGLYIFPPESSMKLTTDLISWCSNNLSKWNTMSVSGYHLREAGCNAEQEIALSLSNGLYYIRETIKTGLEIDDFAPRISFFFACHNNILEEISKFRAARELWYELINEEFSINNPKSAQLRFHTQTSGVTLTAQQPMNNSIRVAFQALSAILGGTQSLHTNSYDEAIGLPSEDAVKIALKTQQILAEESGIIEYPDPLGGSYVVENMTNNLITKSRNIINEIDSNGGALKCMKMGLQQKMIHDSAWKQMRNFEEGNERIVGVNIHNEDNTEHIEGQILDPNDTLSKIQDLEYIKSNRDNKKVKLSLENLRKYCKNNENIMEPLIDALKSEATVGEVNQIFKEEFGTWEAPSGV